MTTRQDGIKSQGSPKSKGWTNIGVVACAAVILTGCAVPLKPLEIEENNLRVKTDLQSLQTVPEPIAGPIDLYDAIARALKYNLDQSLQVMEIAVSTGQLETSTFDMLPDISPSVGYTSRDKNQASTSLGSDNESISVEKNRVQADLTATWSLLDFGLSYMRAQQQADRVMIAEERRRRVVQTVVLSVKEAYWRVVAAERLLMRIEPLMFRIEEILENSRTIEENQLQAPIDALVFQKTLLESLRELRLIRTGLLSAKSELASLMSLPPNIDYQVVVPETRPKAYEAELMADISTLEKVALSVRPELREATYQKRISASDVRLAFYDMLPGIEFNAAYNYDSNKFLVNNDWLTFGADLTGNLMDIYTGRTVINAAEKQMELGEARRLALSMAVLNQVNISAIQYLEAAKEYELSSELHIIEERILEETNSSGAAGQTGEMEMIQADLTSVFAALRRDLAYVDLRRAEGNMMLSLGLDPLPAVLPDVDLETLSDTLEKLMEADENQMFLNAVSALEKDQPSEDQEITEAMPKAALASNNETEEKSGFFSSLLNWF